MPNRALDQLPASAEYALALLSESQVEACCLLEATAFNLLRQRWDQPAQYPRKQAWLAQHIRAFPENNLVAVTKSEVIGFSVTHRWGSLGWLGPIVVSPEWQRLGLGRQMTIRSRDILEEQGCQTIALETWPQHSHNLALYMKSGFMPGALVTVLEKDVIRGTPAFSGQWLSSVTQREEALHKLYGLSSSIADGLDYRPLIQYTDVLGLGDTAIWGPLDQPEAAAVIHFEPYTHAPTPAYTSIELLMIQPGYEAALDHLLLQLHGVAARAGRTALRVYVSSHYAGGLRHLIQNRGYRLIKTRLRMDAKEQAIPDNYVNYLSYGI